ncbi:cystathionine gamma-lyase isoform X2 [Diaphorina citri]|uniref:cystathionine gamma-lyase n=1 Tax=Diaphorina citri TaxID=121845 RepID=A0A1S3DTY5_DIACI|nr:cystathionine gamma-lyase isoform X1 [Diaphorina citri]XP_026675791.1 cystathionine gamma-lyase isoform X2 [Diaphorina citri]XP_026675792.1 cystathionine gamma-lyase isoform X2 [Diaphorina citri]KAI5713174.1 hypothetical protein M8J75_014218 [Diaphorina citri]KAI5756152.1 hypothetical protein M8J77_022568 [Diaphorina citri]
MSFLPQDTAFATKAVHIGSEPDQWRSQCVIPPIILSTTFKQNTPGQPPQGFEYSRSNNPTRRNLERCIASLEEAKHGLCYSSGLGAVTAVTHLLSAGDHIISGDDVYGGTYRYFAQVAPKIGLEVDFVDLRKIENLIKYIKPNTKMVWIENPTNPLMTVFDVKAISAVVKQHPDILLVLDNTFLTAYYQKSLPWGVDIVLYSLTKYMNGHSDVVMGATVTNDDSLQARLKFLQNSMGVVPSPFDCWLVTRGLKTLPCRLKEHERGSIEVAKFLESHPCVKGVLHPGLPSHPNHELAKSQWSGTSGMLSFYVNGGAEETRIFLESLLIFRCAESLGGIESLADLPAEMTHKSIPKETRDALGITDNLVRLSVGVEGYTDLIADLDQALRKACKV